MKKEISRRIIIINFCLTAILVIVAGSIAAYTSLSSAKRVVSTKGAKQLFSSNILYEYDAKDLPSTRVMSFSTDGESNVFKFTVCNYAQGDKTTAREISYTLTVKLLDSDGNDVTDDDVLKAYQLDGTAFSSLKTIKNTLKYDGYKGAEDTYTVTVPSNSMKDYKIYISAASSIEEYNPIGRIISLTETSVSTHWRGEFLDESREPSELGSINTRISGQEDEIMVISWDTKYVEIDPWFLEDIKDYIVDKSDSMIKFEVGSTGQPNQYDISFYRTMSAKSLEESWEDVKKHISFSYESKSTIESTEESTEKNIEESTETGGKEDGE